eukprot:scaffold222_cov176-Ochromonas_danica.AAC.7
MMVASPSHHHFIDQPLNTPHGLPHYFDGKLLDDYYNRRPWQIVSRLLEIGTPVLNWWIATKYDNLTASFRSAEEQSDLVSLRAQQLKDAIVQGKSITFIKSGQALALRQDLLKSADYVRELQKLQDEVGTFDNDVAMQIISDELGRPANEIYEFDPPYPIASASIGQVYRARLKDPHLNNTLVAVKVQRPEALETVGIDMYILRKIAGYIVKKRKLRSDLVGVADEFGSQLYDELNYRKEASNCLKFKQYYGSIPRIYVPDVYFNYTGQRVLTMEFVEGVKGPWKVNGETMLTVGLQCSVLQLLGTGFFHSDPHRGNLLQTPDGKLAYLDFGMMSEVPASKRYAMVGTVLGLVNKDLSMVINSLAELDFFPPETNTTVVIDALNGAIMNATERGKVSSLNFSRLNENIRGIQDKLPVRLPPYYTMIIRSLTILEGLAHYVDKDFRLIKGAYPFILRQILSEPQPEMNRFLRMILLDEKNHIRWERLEQFLTISKSADDAMKGDFQALKDAQEQADVMKQFQQLQSSSSSSSPLKQTPSVQNTTKKGDDRFTVEVVSQVVDYLLSDRGSFLREPLIEEIVDTVESLGITVHSMLSIMSNRLIPAPEQRPDREKVTRFLRLFELVAVGTTNSTMASAGRSRSRAIVIGLGQQVSRFLQSQESAAATFEQWQPVLSKVADLIQQVMQRLLERAAQRTVKTVLSAKNVEVTLPLISKMLDLAASQKL